MKTKWIKVLVTASREVAVEVPEADPSKMADKAIAEALDRVISSNLDDFEAETRINPVLNEESLERFRDHGGLIFAADPMDLEAMAKEMGL